MSSRAELIVKRQRELISFRSKNSASWNPAFRAREENQRRVEKMERQREKKRKMSVGNS
jgi:hypothetical protein